MYNPKFYEVSKEVENKKNGLRKCFIYREKKTQSYYLYEGKDFTDKEHKFLMMAKYFPHLAEFRIYTINAYKYPQLFNPDSHVARVQHVKSKKIFVIKNKFCLGCTSTNSDYFCEPVKQWLFQQELGHFFIVSLYHSSA